MKSTEPGIPGRLGGDERRPQRAGGPGHVVQEPTPPTLDMLASAVAGVASRFQPLRRLGGGGFGDVWEARDVVLERVVALKLITARQEVAPDQLAAALAEARTVARLDHPHIVPLYDAGLESGHIWLAMKRIEGRSLAEELARGGAWPRERSLRLLRQLAGALSHAHRNGVVHRDVKPHNVLVETTEGDHAWLTDFGIALATSDGTSTRSELKLAGTPSYMAPEQVAGKRVDARADIFALGCVAVEMLSGKAAFGGTNVADILDAVVHAPPDGLGDVAAVSGEDVAAVVRRWLAKSPEDRCQSAEEARRDLDRLLGRAPARSRWWHLRRAAVTRWDGLHPLRADKLTKVLGWRESVLQDVDLRVPTGSTFALLGRNGSGKTTLLRTLLGVYRPDRGTTLLFGRDPWRNGASVLSRVGFVPESLYAWERMRVSELLDLHRSAFAGWDDGVCYRLLERFRLPISKRLRQLSRGMRTQASLVCALAHRPELLVLDDPTLGLDAVVIDDLMASLREASRQEGTTVLIASHEHEQLERIASHVGLLKDGRLLLADTLENLKARTREVELRFRDEPPDLDRLENFRVVRTSGRRVVGVALDTGSGIIERLAALHPEAMEVRELGLREIFVNFLR